jgi:hypothetical protein
MKPIYRIFSLNIYKTFGLGVNLFIDKRILRANIRLIVISFWITIPYGIDLNCYELELFEFYNEYKRTEEYYMLKAAELYDNRSE